MNKPWTKTVAMVALVLGAMLLTGCGDDGDTAAGSTTDAEFNDADLAFAQNMIPHHEQAVQMAEMAQQHAASAEVKDLAERIEAAQGPEIEQLTAWLEAWGEEAPTGGMDHGDMGHGDPDSDMGGMMTGEDMAVLGDARGRDFDEMFLEMMIEHHEGAIDMAETEVDEGENADAVELAERIISAQNDEIDEMESMLDP